MQDFLRKHRKLVLWLMAIFLIPTFVYWGASVGGGSPDTDMLNVAIAEVEGEPISAEAFRNEMSAEVARRSQPGRPASVESLVAQGVDLQIIERLVNTRIITQEAKNEEIDFTRAYLTDKIKEWSDFQTPNGQFDSETWNRFVERRDINWNELFAQVRTQEAQNFVIQRAQASARVLEEELRDMFEKQNTALTLRYVKIEPPVNPTDEEIAAYYKKNFERYRTPQARGIQFVALPLMPPAPAVVEEVVTKAKNGEDFAELAAVHSEGPDRDNGGDLGWIAKSLGTPDHQNVLFEMQPGEVRGPIDGPNGYYIFKVEETRVNEQTQATEVKARQIVFQPQPTDQERDAVMTKARTIESQAKESGDLAAAAGAVGATVQTAPPFTVESVEIENVPPDDVRFLRSAVASLEKDAVSTPIPATRNVYVVKVTDVVEGVVPELEEVKAEVTENLIMETRMADPAYQERLQALLAKISADAKSLEDIASIAPDASATIESIGPFTLANYQFGQGPMWNPQEVIALASSKNEGEMFGPVRDYMGGQYFVSVAKKELPSDEVWEKEYPTERENLASMVQSRLENDRVTDYLAYQRERVLWNVDQNVRAKLLGLDQEPAQEGTPLPDTETPPVDVSGEPVVDAPAEATAETPAAEAPAEVPAEAPAETPAEAPAETPAEAPAETPAN